MQSREALNQIWEITTNHALADHNHGDKPTTPSGTTDENVMLENPWENPAAPRDRRFDPQTELMRERPHVAAFIKFDVPVA